ncbi:MAG TPA: methyltransferase domain-containing protein [Solirubrobacteraceae bacterium]|nr:methyltransferase domain-containing protein [Solirubrobacteraceae bacterium]
MSSCSAEMHASERLRMPLVRDRLQWLTELAARTDGEVAHLGCADSPYTDDLLAAGLLLHERLLRVANVTGFDVDDQALDTLRRAHPDARLVNADITQGVPADDRNRYALVIAGEVLEHVPDADAFLRATAELLAPGGQLAVTVPNACCPKIGLRSLAGRESVHPDHRVYYGPRTLTRTLAGAGFETDELASCFAPIQGSAGRYVFNPLLGASHRLFQGPVGDGLIATASARPNASAIAS